MKNEHKTVLKKLCLLSAQSHIFELFESRTRHCWACENLRPVQALWGDIHDFDFDVTRHASKRAHAHLLIVCAGSSADASNKYSTMECNLWSHTNEQMQQKLNETSQKNTCLQLHVFQSTGERWSHREQKSDREHCSSRVFNEHQAAS